MRRFAFQRFERGQTLPERGEVRRFFLRADTERIALRTRFLNVVFARFERFFQFFCDGLFPFDRILALFYVSRARKQIAAFLPARTARHGAARCDRVAVERDDLERARITLCDARGVADIVADKRIAQKVADNVGIIRIVCNKLFGKPERAFFAQRAFDFAAVAPRAHGGNGQERDDAAARLLQILNQIARVVLGRGDEVLHRRAERRFDRHFVPFFGRNDVGNRAFDLCAERLILLRFDLQRAHAVAVAVEAVFQTLVKFKIVFKIGDRGIAVDHLFRYLLSGTDKGSKFVGDFTVALRFFFEEFFARRLLLAAFLDLAVVFFLLRARFFDRLFDFGDPFARGVAPCRKAARLRADIGKVFHRRKLACAFFVEHPFVSDDARVRFRDPTRQRFAFAHDLFGALLPAFARFHALFD